MKCIILETLPTVQEVLQENALAAVLQPLVNQIAALTTQVTAVSNQQTQLSNQQTQLSNKQDSLRALFINSLAESMDDTLTVPVMNHTAPPEFMPTTVGELMNLKTGANTIAIENYFNLPHTGNMALRMSRLRRAYGCRRILIS